MEKEPNQNEGTHGILNERINRFNDLRELDVKRIDEIFKATDIKYQIQFNAAKDALGIALIAQEKQTAAALEGTKEAINKADVATDKRFSLLSEKIDGVVETINKNTGSQGIYVTHTDLSVSLDKLQTNIETALRPVIAFMNSQQGQSKGAGTSWQSMVTIVSVCGMLVGIFFALSK